MNAPQKPYQHNERDADAEDEKNACQKSHRLSQRQKMFLWVSLVLLFMLSLLVIYGQNLYQHFMGKIDLESMMLLHEWTDDVIAEDVDQVADLAKAKEFNTLIKGTSKTEAVWVEGPWCPVDEETLGTILKTYEPALSMWRPLVEEEKVFIEKRAQSYRDVIAYTASATTTGLDIDPFIPEFIPFSTMRETGNLLRAKTYSELQKGDYASALDTLYFNARLTNPVRLQFQVMYIGSDNLRHGVFNDYRRLMQYDLTPDALRTAWKDVIALRKYRIDKKKYTHLRQRSEMTLFLPEMCMQEGLSRNKHLKEAAEIRKSLFAGVYVQRYALIASTVDKCWANPDFFEDPEIREEAAKRGDRHGSTFSFSNGPIGLTGTAMSFKWLNKAAQKDRSFMKRYNMPEDTQARVDPFTALVYLEGGEDSFKIPVGKAIKDVLIEIALAARCIYVNTRQWPSDIEEIRTCYEKNGYSFPDAPYEAEIAFHAGWIKPGFEIRKTLWTEQLPLNFFPPERKPSKKPPENSNDYELIKEHFDNYAQWSNNPSSATLTLSAEYDTLFKIDSLGRRFARHNEIVEKIQVDILISPEASESENWEWLAVDSDMIKQIEAENNRLGKVFDKKNPPPEKPAYELVDLGNGMFSYKIDQKQTALRNKYEENRKAYIENPENRETPYPMANRMRCWLKAPEKIYAVWAVDGDQTSNTLPAAISSKRIVFPQGF